MAVDGVLQLVTDLPETVHDHPALALREVQRLVHLVRKEAVFLHVAAQRRAADEVRMENQRPALRLELPSVVLESDHLPGRQTDERSLLIVVIVPAVDHVAALDLLEKDRIETVGLPEMPHRMRLGQIDDAHQRVQRFDAQHRIVLGDGLQMMNFLFHDKVRFPQIYGFYRLCARPAGEIRNRGKRIRNPSTLRAGPGMH